jgi:hypothetical protein
MAMRASTQSRKTIPGVGRESVRRGGRFDFVTDDDIVPEFFRKVMQRQKKQTKTGKRTKIIISVWNTDTGSCGCSVQPCKIK